MSVWVEVATTVGGLITAVGGAAGLRALFRRRPRPTRADAAVALSAGTIRWAEKMEAQAENAWRRAEAAEAKADEADARAEQAQRHAARIEVQLSQVVGYLDRMLRAINDPGMDMETLRRIAAEGPPVIHHQ